MSTRKNKKHSKVDSLKNFEQESIMNFQAMKLDAALKILKESGIYVSKEEVSEILLFANSIAKITIKEFILNKE